MALILVSIEELVKIVVAVDCLLTGQTPPEMMRSNDKASGIPLLMQELHESMESLIDLCFSSPLIESLESLEDVTCEGRRYPSE